MRPGCTGPSSTVPCRTMRAMQRSRRFQNDYLANFDGFKDCQCEKPMASMPESGDSTKRFDESKARRDS